MAKVLKCDQPNLNISVSDQEKDRIRKIASLLYEGSRYIRILKAVSWDNSVKEEFFANKAQELPKVTYQPINPTPVIEAVREARRMIVPINPIDLWLERQADSVERGARMLANLGNSSFFEYSRQLYGEPSAPMRYFPSTPLELAQTIDDAIAQLACVDIKIAPSTYHSAEVVAQDIDRAVKEYFGEDAPKVELVDKLSANALATTSSISIRKDAQFTDRDASQLLNHEAYIHVATSLNGRLQKDLPILAAGHPGTTRTQEGLAVYAEIISGSMELDRMRRLADRVFAIQMAIEGADFLEVYRYFLERVQNEDQAFENARRVFRGGVLTGGAPFTKDGVYLFGLLAVSSSIRAVFMSGRSDCLRLLFCGKLDVMDVPALCELYAMGLCQPPRYLPPWVSDPRFLLSFLTYSTFMGKIDIQPLVNLAQKLLETAPIVIVDS